MDINSMGCAEIFAALLAQQKKAVAFHEQMCVMFNFMNLHGFKRWHEYQNVSESATMCKIYRHYIKHHDKLIKPMPVEEINDIPSDWYNAERGEVTSAIIAQYTKRGLQAHIQWETDSLDNLNAFAKRLFELDEIDDYKFVSCLICDVSKELEKAKRVYYKISATGFDVVFIEEMQDKLHDKYKEMLK